MTAVSKITAEVLDLAEGYETISDMSADLDARCAALAPRVRALALTWQEVPELRDAVGRLVSAAPAARITFTNALAVLPNDAGAVLSTRALAEVTGVGKSQVSRDGTPDTKAARADKPTEGLDGKVYQPKAAPAEKPERAPAAARRAVEDFDDDTIDRSGFGAVLNAYVAQIAAFEMKVLKHPPYEAYAASLDDRRAAIDRILPLVADIRRLALALDHERQLVDDINNT